MTNLETYFAPIAMFDLAPIKAKLMHKESGEGWSRDYADAVEYEYRRFLYLIRKFPDEPVAPILDVDLFWHYHILDTMKYAADCELIFGYFLHHCPSSGSNGEDEGVQERSDADMRKLYEATFGEGCLLQQENKWVTAAAESARYSQATAKSAYCFRAKAKAAWCSQAVQKTAFCDARKASVAFCQSSKVRLAFCDARKASACSVKRQDVVAAGVGPAA
jgi:hypothetical protein